MKKESLFKKRMRKKKLKIQSKGFPEAFKINLKKEQKLQKKQKVQDDQTNINLLKEISEENKKKISKMTKEEVENYSKIIKNFYSEDLLKKISNKSSTHGPEFNQIKEISNISSSLIENVTERDNSINKRKNLSQNSKILEYNFQSLNEVFKILQDFEDIVFKNLFDVNSQLFNHKLSCLSSHFRFDRNEDYVSNLVKFMKQDSQNQIMNFHSLKDLLITSHKNANILGMKALSSIWKFLNSSQTLDYYLYKEQDTLKLQTTIHNLVDFEILNYDLRLCKLIYSRLDFGNMGNALRIETSKENEKKRFNEIKEIMQKTIKNGQAIHFQKISLNLQIFLLSELNIFQSLGLILKKKNQGQDILKHLITALDLVISTLYQINLIPKQKISQFSKLETYFFGNDSSKIQMGKIKQLAHIDILLLLNIYKQNTGKVKYY